MTTGIHRPRRDDAGTALPARLPVGGPGPTAHPPARSSGHPLRATGAVSRVSVLAPRTRVDVALPADVPLADLVPVLLDMAGEPAGTAASTTGPGWTLAPLGRAPVDPERTLGTLGVLDGDQLVLRRRADAAPAPLYDDVVDAVAEAAPVSWRAWDTALAHRLGLAGLGTALAVAVLALGAAGRGPGTAGGIGTAAVAGVAAVLAIALGALLARVAGSPAAGAVLAVGGVALAAVCGVAAVPSSVGGAGGAAGGSLLDGSGPPHLLLGAVLAVLAAGAALATSGTSSRAGLAALVALATAGTVAVVTGGIATLVAPLVTAPGGGPDAAAVAAGAGALALVALSGLPRAGIALARLPLPRVPASPEELADDPDAAEHAEVERRADRAHAAMAGLVLGVGLVVVAAVAVLAAGPADGGRGVAGWVLAVLLAVLPALRSRSYANAVHAVVLLVCGLLAGAAVLLGAVAAAPPGAPRLGLAAVALVAGGVTLLLGSVAPRRRSSPVARRAVDVAEAVGIAAVLPLALAAMDLYTAMRLL